FAGILPGVRSCPLAISLVTLTTLTAFGAGAAAGGGGGGGGGASRKVNSCCLGSTSVNHNGTRIRTPTSRHCRTHANNVVHVLCLRCPLLASSRLSSNSVSRPAAGTQGLVATASQLCSIC